jgi:hypothetical protein
MGAERPAPAGMESIGIYTCYTGLPAGAIGFFKSCGYNTYQCWEQGWTKRPASHERYYADLAQAIQRFRNAGFRVHVLLTVNMRQCRDGEPEGYSGAVIDPGDRVLVQERLEYVAKAVRKLRMADGFTVFAGDPGGHQNAEPAQFSEAADKMIAIVRREAPRAEVAVNPWSIAAWDHMPSPFSVAFWEKETVLTRQLMRRSDLFGPGVNIEFPLHNYYRSLALKCYADAGKEPSLCPTAEEVQSLRQRGVKRLWGWPYFLTDECDDGYKGATSGLAQSETRYIKQAIDTGRRLGLNGMIANAFESNVFAESLNLYAFARFCRDPAATPEQVILEFAGLISKPETAGDLAQVIKFIENHSTWQSGLPEKHRLANFDVGTLKSAAEASQKLAKVAVREPCPLPILKPPAAYVEKLNERLAILAGPGRKSAGPGKPPMPTSGRNDPAAR